MIKWRTFVVGGLSFLAAGLLGVAAHDWVDAPLWGQPNDGTTVYVWPVRPPGVTLWPQADYPIHCTPGGVRQARDYFSRVTGMVRRTPPSASQLAGGVEVLMEPAVKCVRFGPPPDRQCLEWATDFDRERWESLGPSNQLYANVYYRVGPCWIGGHGHGQDGEVGASEDVWFPRIYGRAPTMMERTDIKYFPMNSPPLGLWWMRAEYNRLEGNPVPTPTPHPPVCRAPCRLEFGVCNCPDPSPTPALPTPTPGPTLPPPVASPTPPRCPECKPCSTCATYTQMPDRHRQNLLAAPFWPRPLTPARKKALDAASDWVKAHLGSWFVDGGGVLSTSSTSLGWECADGQVVATLESCVGLGKR